MQHVSHPNDAKRRIFLPPFLCILVVAGIDRYWSVLVISKVLGIGKISQIITYLFLMRTLVLVGIVSKHCKEQYFLYPALVYIGWCWFWPLLVSINLVGIGLHWLVLTGVGWYTVNVGGLYLVYLGAPLVQLGRRAGAGG